MSALEVFATQDQVHSYLKRVDEDRVNLKKQILLLVSRLENVLNLYDGRERLFEEQILQLLHNIDQLDRQIELLKRRYYEAIERGSESSNFKIAYNRQRKRHKSKR